MDEVLVEIGGKNTMPEFTENLRGANRRRPADFRSDVSGRYAAISGSRARLSPTL